MPQKYNGNIRNADGKKVQKQLEVDFAVNKGIRYIGIEQFVLNEHFLE